MKMRKWCAKWIAYPDINMVDWRRPVVPAPVFRKTFVLREDIKEPVIYICGLGYFLFYIDGERITDNMLQPAPTQYDRRWRYRKFNLKNLEAGTHRISVTVGNGLYHTATPDVWHFDKADWQDYPKMICELEDAWTGEILLTSDSTWSVCSGPVVFHTLRGGETYDARRELPQGDENLKVTAGKYIAEIWPAPDSKMEQKWTFAGIVPSPGGIGQEEDFQPCRIINVLPMEQLNKKIYSAPYNLSGVVRLTVRGECGAKVVLRHGERLTENGEALDNRFIANLVCDDSFQKDTYILKGGSVEIWNPEFTYHGFQFVELEYSGEVEIIKLEALEIHTDFKQHGFISSSEKSLQILDNSGVRSVLSNFVGIPTDCPQREKNGWTSESRLQMETLLYSYDAIQAYGAYAELMADAQRPSGQLPGMVPSAGWGYNWGSSPAWDYALFAIPYTLYLFSGEKRYILDRFDNMLRNLDFLDSLEDVDGLIKSGLGDWLCSSIAGEMEKGYVQNIFRVQCLKIAEKCADILNRKESEELRERHKSAQQKILQHYYNGNGKFKGSRSTTYALALEFDIVPEEARGECAYYLNEIIKQNRYRVDYGTIGSGCVLRALFENGYSDTAYQMMIQKEEPGYMYWFDSMKLTSFPEMWGMPGSSLNHGAFSDIIACMYRYLGGFRHSEDKPGKKFLKISPVFPAALNDFSAEYIGYKLCWQKENNGIMIRVSIPVDCEAQLQLNEETQTLFAGNHKFFVKNHRHPIEC